MAITAPGIAEFRAEMGEEKQLGEVEVEMRAIGQEKHEIIP